MPRLGARKLYFLLEQSFVENGIKIGRDAFFAYLKREQMLVKPIKITPKLPFLNTGYVNILIYLKILMSTERNKFLLVI